MTKILQLKKSGPQWEYRIIESGRVLVEWQYGLPFKDLTIEQAVDRFGISASIEVITENNK